MKIDPKKLKRIREENNLTQKELADRIGVSNATVSQYEHNPMKPKKGVLSKMLKVLNTTEEELKFNGQNDTNLKDAIKTLIELKPELQEAIATILQALKES